jgi:hypothetical protein
MLRLGDDEPLAARKSAVEIRNRFFDGQVVTLPQRRFDHPGRERGHIGIHHRANQAFHNALL